jgi:hypothetical protein
MDLWLKSRPQTIDMSSQQYFEMQGVVVSVTGSLDERCELDIHWTTMCDIVLWQWSNLFANL